jgi:two-component system, sensor histidine kinase and response regulator
MDNPKKTDGGKHARQELDKGLERPLAGLTPEGPEMPVAEVENEQEIFDKKNLWERLGEDEGIFQEIIKTFLEDTPLQIQKLRDALKQGDFLRLERQAHLIKGAAMNMGGKRLQAVSFEIEVAGKNGDLSKAHLLMEKLAQEYDQLEKALLRQIV